jgi:hypothetical protein
MLPSSSVNEDAIEYSPSACFEQYRLRRAIRLVKWVVPIPNTCLVRMWSTRFWRSGIASSKPFVRRIVISRRKTPDFVTGSRNVTSGFAQMFLRLFASAQASVSVSSIRLTNAGGVNTSSFDRFAMHVRMSGLRRRANPALVVMQQGLAT